MTAAAEDTFVATPDFDALVAELGNPKEMVTAITHHVRECEKTWREVFGIDLNSTYHFPVWPALREITDQYPDPEWPTVDSIWDELFPIEAIAGDIIDAPIDLGYLSLPLPLQEELESDLTPPENNAVSVVDTQHLEPVAEPLALPAAPAPDAQDEVDHV